MEKLFLQGFEFLNWDYENDKCVAFEQDSEIINEIREVAHSAKIATSFGYVERDKDKLNSIQIMFGAEETETGGHFL